MNITTDKTISTNNQSIMPTVAGGISVPWLTTSNVSFNPTGMAASSTKITLNGPNADIEVNGQSLLSMIRGIEQRLNILQLNPELEKEWAELKLLGDQYRDLEKQLQEKAKMWSTLNQ